MRPDVDGLDTRLTAPAQTAIASEHNEPIATPPETDTTYQYILYKLLPSVGTLPQIYGITQNKTDTPNEENPRTELPLQIGLLQLTQPELTDTTIQAIEEGTAVDEPAEKLHELLHQAITEGVLESDYTDIYGNQLTITFPMEIIEHDSQLHECLDAQGEWNNMRDLLSVLADSDSYPLTERDDEIDMYDYKTPIELTPLSEAIDWCDTHDVFVDAIEHYRKGVFANKPGLAVTFAMVEQYNDRTQREVAEMIGVEPSTLSHQLSTVDTWIDRAIYTTSKHMAIDELDMNL